ncbi:MAG: anthranilate synthase component 1, partial [Deltaproteobacteria bacterium]|nr:anthranilate synthase component 1 [Deltaproteobacteria bacterium]
AGEKSLLVLSAALRLTCEGLVVTAVALNANGRNLLPWLAGKLTGAAHLSQSKDALRIVYPPAPQGSEDERLFAPSPSDVLRVCAAAPLVKETSPALTPLVAGVFSYDFLGAYEKLPPWRADPLRWPDYEFWLPDQMIWVHHHQERVTAVTLAYGGERFAEVYHDAGIALAKLSEACQARLGESGREQTLAGGAVHTDIDDAAFAEMVRTVKRHIIAGDVYQIVPSRTFSLPCTDALAAYGRLRELNPSPYMFFVRGAAGTLFGASPETAVKVNGKRRVEIRPIAGTRPRARVGAGPIDADADNRLEAELRLDGKELAEHMMLVDLARNDVARVSVSGTRAVERLLGVDRYAHVMHLVTHVTGELRPDLDALHAYVATMNMGTLVGAPKLKAAALLRQYEVSKRGPYGGAVGYFSHDGQMDTCIVIRSAVVQDGMAHVRAGAGVVLDSDPEAETRETRSKAESVLQAVRG